MPSEVDEVAVRVSQSLLRITDERLVAALKKHFVAPRACLLDWDYGHPHPEFPEPRYPAFVVAEFTDSGTGIAYSEYGFGPVHPWGLIRLAHPRFGMDCGWYATLEAAFRESMAWREPSPPGYEVD